MRIRLADPEVNEEARGAVLDVLASGQLVAGNSVAGLEEDLCRVTGRRFAVMMSSGTAALFGAMRAMSIGPGSVVVVPAFTFPAPAMAAAFLGAEVRLCDVDPDTLTMSAKTLQTVLSPDVDLVVPVDLFGMPAHIPEIESLCRTVGATVLVDAACSLGSSLGGRPCGSFGAAAVFSFHPRKLVTTFEGGAVLTDDPELARLLRGVRNVGQESGSFCSVGLNLRPSEPGAALGRVQLQSLDRSVAARNQLAEVLHRLPLKFQKKPPQTRVNFQSMVASIDISAYPAGREGLMEAFAACGIESRIAGWSLALVAPLSSRFGFVPGDYPVSLEWHLSGVALPIHQRLSILDVEEVVACAGRWLSGQGVDK